VTIILGIFVRDSFGNGEIIFASDGRAMECETNNNGKTITRLRSEDVDKIRKLTPEICIGYAGNCSELFEDVYKELKDKISEMIKEDLESFTKRLQEIILEIKNTERYIKIEKESGPLIHKFIVGGAYNDTLVLIRLHSKDEYKIKKDEFLSSPDISYLVDGATEEVHKKVKNILDEKLLQIQNFDGISNKIVYVIRYVISKAAELHPHINNHVFIRRLSRNFDLEKYIGYE